MASEFAGKVAIVTGAGRGIGRAHALAFADRGAHVVVNDLGAALDGSGAGDAADQVVAEIRARGGSAVANRDSVADPESARRIVQAAVDAFGTVDIVVNNAGNLRDRTFGKMSIDDWNAVIAVHLNGTAFVTHAAWPILYAKNYGRIVFTTSPSGYAGNFGQPNYGAAKTGVIGLMNVLSLEGRSHGIRVNCVSPAATTRMAESVPGADPTRNPRDPALVSPAVLYLASEDAPTNVIIRAAGGSFSSVQFFTNAPVDLGRDVTYEQFVEHAPRILDMSSVRPVRQSGGTRATARRGGPGSTPAAT
jgi:NAD(P)-dependent dehydrogenase (short-subunit alcohol dehydrogenase family)